MLEVVQEKGRGTLGIVHPIVVDKETVIDDDIVVFRGVDVESIFLAVTKVGGISDVVLVIGI